MKRWAIAAAVCAAGCVSVLPEAGPPPDIYRLDTPNAGSTRLSTASATRGDWTLTVAEPLAPRALATDRIAVMADGRHLSYAAGARWNERAPRVVQERVISAFEADARVRAVVRPEDGVNSRYEIVLELLRFEAVYGEGAGAAPTVDVDMRAKLVDRDTRDLIAATRIGANETASANRMSDIITAFDDAMAKTGRALTDWAVDAVTEVRDGGRAQVSESAASSSR